ncbi:hypothetical protein I4300191C4_02980 [Solibaculum mannosilyticum]
MNSNSKLFSVLSYFGFLWVIGLVAAPQDSYVRFHVNQGLVLFLLEIVISAARFILGFIPIIRWFTGLLTGLLGIFTLVLFIMGVVNAAQGKMKPLPIIGGITIVH